MGLDQDQEEYLEQLFGDRVSFDGVERKLYGHDIAAMPKLVKPIVGKTLPDAVVQPQNADEVAELAWWARKEEIPLVPRGKATSGYAGAVPVEGGIVVDFYRMAAVESIDANSLEVTVQPGITWERLDRELKHKGLTLRLYPSSYPSSTVGGWLAQGGAGFGSYEFGYFKDNVVSAEIVLPDGNSTKYSGKDLELVSEAEGITGFITSVTVKIQPLEDLEVVALSCPTAKCLQKAIQGIMDAKLPVWSLMFINPRMAQMRNKAHAGMKDDKDHVSLPESYIVVLTFRSKDMPTTKSQLFDLVEKSGSKVLDDKIADSEWKNRFKIMLIKRLGPSLVPAEVIVPVNKLGVALDEIEKKVHHPVLKEGIIVANGPSGKPEAVLLGFIPADERKIAYNFMFALSLTIARIAGKHGGRPYATGLYFSGMANKILGREHVRMLREFKKKVDPGRLMNPGKVVDTRLLSLFMLVANFFEPFVRPVGNIMSARAEERPGGEVKGVPGDVVWFAYACSQCGYCVDVCDQFYGRGWESQSPRGKWYWLREYLEGREKWDQKMVDDFLVCTTCEACDRQCSASLPIESSWMKMRGALIERDKRMTFPPFEMMAEALDSQGDIWAGYRKDRDNWFPEDLREKHGPGKKADTVYFAGCTASYVEQDIAISTVRLLDAAGVDFTCLGEKESCCATPMLVAGKWDLFKQTMRKNIDAVKETGADTVVCSCPACDMMWRKVYPEWAEKLGIDYDIKAVHYSEVLAEKINSGEFEFPGGNGGKEQVVTFHDSCHIGRVSGVYEPPRTLAGAVPNTKLVEMDHNREDGLCCGSVLTLIKEPDVAAEIGKDRLEEVEKAGAEKVVALCPCCEFQLRVSADKKGLPVEVVDLAHFAAEALGFELPDPHPEVKAQWAVFEAMIELMTPEGFADLMSTMWPELIKAMPLGMGYMMKLMGRIPGALDLMKPMFPILFPRLLPLMMPKVMPVMLSRVEDMIPMPDYMREQMPDLMPKVMDSLMPHMIGDVVPLVTEPMIEYLEKN